MERYTISKSEKQTIYEIYRACRICGAGGGYRMPIIQNIVDLDTSDVELRKKIQDCLQLEVRPDDRMPPLICELCVDKVNDFYVFLELSRQTNIRTRTRLGLPLQTVKKEEPEPANCILGVTEPLCADKPAPKKSTAGPKCSKKVNGRKETENVNVKPVAATPSPVESRSSSVSSRSSRASRRPPSPRPSRAPINEPPKTALKQYHNKAIQDKKKVIEKEKEPEKEKQVKGAPSTKFSMLNKELQDLIQDNQKYDDNSLLVPRSMKRKEIEPPRPAVIAKRTRTTPKEPVIEPVKEPSPPRQRPGPKSRRVAPKEDPKPKPPPKEEPKIPVPLKIPKSKSKLNVTPPKVEAPPAKVTLNCPICDVSLKTNAALTNHLKSHLPTFTKPQHACNPCGKWFLSAEAAAAHHGHHRAATFPYHCRRCFDDYKTLLEYDNHIANGLCMPYDVIPDVKCDRCWKTFITRTLLDGHKCQGSSGRPGGSCPKCSRTYVTQKTLKMHLKVCTYRKKNTGDLKADPDVLRRLKPMQVRIARCDDLLARRTGDRYISVSTVRSNHGLDKNYLYPYFRLNSVKSVSRLNSKVPKHGPIRDEPERDGYTHWDSDDSDSDSVIKKVDNLTVLCLKKIFSKNVLGKVPRKRRVKNDVFDSINDFSASSDINDIISSLNDDLASDCLSKNRKDSLISIAINDIIGVPNTFVPNLDLGNGNVVRSSNDVHIDDKNENDNLKNLNDVDIENHGTDTVVSASDISAELNLIETEDQENTRNDAAIERMADDMETNDSETRNDLNFVNGNDLNNDLEIRNFKSVDPDNFKDSNETNVQNNLSTEDDYEKAELNHSENNDGNLENQSKSDNVDGNDYLANQNANTGNEIPNNDSETSNDNLDIKNNCANIKESDDLETQYVNNEHENPDYDSEMHNYNVGTENNYDNPASNKLKIENENNIDQHVNVESDLKNDNLIINPSDTKNYGDDGMNNDLETQNLNSETNLGNTQNDNINRNYLVTENNENTELNREDKTENSEDIQEVEEPNLQNSMEKELQNSHVNGINEYNTQTNSNLDESEKLEEAKKITKESPIKHSIENLIGDTDKNPDKYIDEVISSIEDIINKNPRKEEINDTTNGENSNEMDDQMLMDAIDTEISDKIDSEKITLDDLLPKNNTAMELDDISDEDFNFDA